MSSTIQSAWGKLRAVQALAKGSAAQTKAPSPPPTVDDSLWEDLKLPLVGAACPEPVARDENKLEIKRFTVIRKIAETTLGDVFEAEDSISGFRVAIKSHRKFRLTEKQTQSLVRQIKILARLRHPHIVRLWAVFEDLITLYIVYELCQQPTALVQSCFQDERVTVSKIIAPLASALAHVHSKGILHRGVHPSALLVRPSGEVCLSGWDFAIDTHAERPVTSSVGVPSYCAPEVFLNDQAGIIQPREEVPPEFRRAYSDTLDVWALGTLLCFLVSSRAPFGVSDAELSRKICHEEPTIIGALSNLARDAVLKCLHKDMTARPSMLEVLDHPLVHRNTHQEDRLLLVRSPLAAMLARGGFTYAPQELRQAGLQGRGDWTDPGSPGNEVGGLSGSEGPQTDGLASPSTPGGVRRASDSLVGRGSRRVMGTLAAGDSKLAGPGAFDHDQTPPSTFQDSVPQLPSIHSPSPSTASVGGQPTTRRVTHTGYLTQTSGAKDARGPRPPVGIAEMFRARLQMGASPGAADGPSPQAVQRRKSLESNISHSISGRGTFVASEDSAHVRSEPHLHRRSSGLQPAGSSDLGSSVSSSLPRIPAGKAVLPGSAASKAALPASAAAFHQTRRRTSLDFKRPARAAAMTASDGERRGSTRRLGGPTGGPADAVDRKHRNWALGGQAGVTSVPHAI